MNVIIRVFKQQIAVQIGNGPVLWFWDWVMAMAVIRDEDSVIVQVWQN